MAAIPGSVRLTGFVAPTDSTDTYPVIDPIWGIDGLRSVADAATRNAIPAPRRRAGMIVFTQDTSEYWTLLPSPWAFNSTDWSLFSSGGVVVVPTVAIGTNIIDSIATALAADVNWELVAQKAGVRLSLTLRTNHDGTTAYYGQTQIEATPGTIDITFSASVSGANLRLIAVAGSLGWSLRYRREYLPV